MVSIIIKSFLKYILLSILFLPVFFIEQSILPHFQIIGIGLNLSFIVIFLLNFLPKEQNQTIIFVSALAGLLLDFSSNLPFGVMALSFIILAFLIQKASSFFYEPNTFSFLIIFSFSFLIYKLLFITSFLSPLFLIFEFLFNMAFVLVLFVIYEMITK